MSRNRRERGEGQLGCLVGLVLLLIAGLIAYRLIPVKVLDFPNTVNLTLGLPMIRTSVDHGTAFDIAGKNRADPSSFIAAVELAARFTQLAPKRRAS